MISYTGEPTYTTHTLENVAPRLVVIHQSDRKHVTKEDVERLERNGFVVLSVEYTNKVRVIDAIESGEPQDGAA